jgi:hypothetical protein
MQINLDISVLYQKLFGPTNAFDPEFATLPAKNENFYGVDRQGYEYYLPVNIQVPNTKAEQLGVRDADGAFNGRWTLPYPVIAARSNKTIIDTALTERSGLVSELINVDGWRFVIKGVLIGIGNEFPEEDFAILTRLYQLNVPIRMFNGMSDILMQASGSDEVVIRSLDFMPMPGVQHVRGYVMELTSNEPFNLLDIS